jgi:hypothetical protein
MASVRLAVVRTAQRLAEAAVEMAPAVADGCAIPAETIDRLQHAARVGERPTSTLRWAWRSQTARYVDSGGDVDGLAVMYLLAALIKSDTADGRNDAPVRIVS